MQAELPKFIKIDLSHNMSGRRFRIYATPREGRKFQEYSEKYKHNFVLVLKSKCGYSHFLFFNGKSDADIDAKNTKVARETKLSPPEDPTGMQTNEDRTYMNYTNREVGQT